MAKVKMNIGLLGEIDMREILSFNFGETFFTEIISFISINCVRSDQSHHGSWGSCLEMFRDLRICEK